MDEARARELLSLHRERIERTLADLEKPEGGDELSDIDQHPADQATTLYDEELDEGLAGDLREQLAAIERAEERVDEGTYGRSVESGEPIPDGRLEAIPWAERTAKEQERYDHRG